MKSNVGRWGPFFIWRPFGYWIFGITRREQYIVLVSMRVSEYDNRREIKHVER